MSAPNGVELFIYTLEKVNELKEQVKCPKCFKVLSSPVLASCSHIFCSECFDSIIISKEPGTKSFCPICKKGINQRKKTPHVPAECAVKFINSIQVKLQEEFGNNKEVLSELIVNYSEFLETEKATVDPFDKIANPPIRTYKNTAKLGKNEESIISNAVSSFENSQSRRDIIKWLSDNKNEFDRLTQTTQTSDDNDDFIDAAQMHQQSKKKLKKNEMRRCKSFNEHVVKTVKPAVKRKSAGNVNLIPKDKENLIHLVKQMENDVLDNFNKEYSSGWTRLQTLNKTTNNKGHTIKKLKVENSQLKVSPPKKGRGKAKMSPAPSNSKMKIIPTVKLTKNETIVRDEGIEEIVKNDMSKRLAYVDLTDMESFFEKRIPQLIQDNLTQSEYSVFEPHHSRHSETIKINEVFQSKEIELAAPMAPVNVSAESEDSELFSMATQKVMAAEVTTCNVSYIEEFNKIERKILAGNSSKAEQIKCIMQKIQPYLRQLDNIVKDDGNSLRQLTNDCAMQTELSGIGRGVQTDANPIQSNSTQTDIYRCHTCTLRDQTSFSSKCTQTNTSSERVTISVQTDDLIEIAESNILSDNLEAFNISTQEMMNQDVTRSEKQETLTQIMDKLSKNANRVENNNSPKPSTSKENQSISEHAVDMELTQIHLNQMSLIKSSGKADRIMHSTPLDVNRRRMARIELSAIKANNDPLLNDLLKQSLGTESQNDILLTMEPPPKRSSRRLSFTEDNTNKNFKRIRLESDSEGEDENVNKFKRNNKRFMQEQVLVQFDTQSQARSPLTQIKFSGSLDSDLNMDLVDKVWDKIDKGLLGKSPAKVKPSFNTQKTPMKESNSIQELLNRCDRLVEHVTKNLNKPNSNDVFDDDDKENGVEEAMLNFKSADVINKENRCDEIVEHVTRNLNKRSAKSVFDDSDKKNDIEEAMVNFRSAQNTNKENLNNVNHVFDADDDKENEIEEAMLNFRSAEVINKENVMQEIRNRNVVSSDEEIFQSDGELDVIEDTPTKEFPRLKDADRTITPPLEFQDSADSTLLPSTPNNDCVNSLQIVSQSQEFSPITNLLSNKTLQMPRTFHEALKRKRCSTPKSQSKQLSLNSFIKKNKEKDVSFEKRKPCVACTRLANDQVRTILSLANRRLITYSSVFNENVTHMIVNTNERNQVKDDTIKYVSAVASGAWVLNFKWIKDCLANNSIVNELSYEVLDSSGLPGPKESRLYRKLKPLFRGFRIHAAPPFTSTTRSDVENVVTMLGGRIAKRMDEFLDKTGEIYLIITETGTTQEFNLYETWLETLRVITVDVEWLSRSVGQYKLDGVRRYALCSDEALCNLGYPEDLLGPEATQRSFL